MSAKIPTIVRPLKSFAMIHKRGWIDPLDNPTLLLLLLYFYFFFFFFFTFFFCLEKKYILPARWPRTSRDELFQTVKQSWTTALKTAAPRWRLVGW